MKIDLSNFRCYSKKSFDFGEKGLVLLSGPSGIGKTTILMAIQFCLYGTGQKIIKYGEKKCKVEFEMNNMKIIRSKGPNRLVLIMKQKFQYEDDSAQHIINDIFGTKFDITSYIKQNAINSFILMSPTDKLKFLEVFTFKNINLDKIKKRCKELISKNNESLIKSKSKLELSTNLFENKKEPEKVTFPIRCPKDKRNKYIKNENVKYKNCEILIKRYTKKINLNTDKLNDKKLFDLYVESKKENIERFENEILENENYKNINIDEIESKILENEKKLELYLNHKELIRLKKINDENKKKLKDMLENEKLDLEKELNNILEINWKEYKKDECKELIKDNKSILEDIRNINYLESEIKEIDTNKIDKLKDTIKNKKDILEKNKEKLTVIKQKLKSYKCPKCNIELNLNNGKLEELKIDNNELEDLCEKMDLDEIKDEIDELESEINKYEKRLMRLESYESNNQDIKNKIDDIFSKYECKEDLNEEDVEETIKYLREYYSEHKKLESKYESISEKIKNEDFSSSYNKFKENYEKDKLKLKKLESKVNEEELLDIDEECIRKEIKKDEEELNKSNRIKNRLIELEKLINKEKLKCENKKEEFLEKYGDIDEIDVYSDIIKDNELLLKQTQEKKVKVIETLNKIEKYNKYVEEMKEYLDLKNKVKKFEKEVKEDTKKYSSSKILKEKILEAESIALGNIIESINTHSQIYLEKFFPDHPIIVKLLPFKETKKNIKPQINISIDYKNMNIDISSLSGGELSRVVLAFTLSLCEMFNSPLLMLDESTASLDEELTSDVFETIKEQFSNKLVIIIAHQIVTGSFDKKILLQDQR